MPDSGCLVIDYHMPGMKIALPTILITGHPSIALRRRATEVGVPLVEKPLLGNGLVETIRTELGRIKVQ